MKKFAVAAIFLFCLMFNVSASANAVQIYDGRVERIVEIIKQYCNGWGTEYYTYQGAKRCELHFGNTDENLVRFRLNNDNSVSRFLITMPSDAVENSYSDSINAGFVMGVVLGAAGLNSDEIRSLWTKFMNGVENFVNYNPYATHFHEKYTVWCSKTSRYVVMDVEFDTKKVEFYFYAHD